MEKKRLKCNCMTYRLKSVFGEMKLKEDLLTMSEQTYTKVVSWMEERCVAACAICLLTGMVAYIIPVEICHACYNCLPHVQEKYQQSHPRKTYSKSEAGLQERITCQTPHTGAARSPNKAAISEKMQTSSNSSSDKNEKETESDSQLRHSSHEFRNKENDLHSLSEETLRQNREKNMKEKDTEALFQSETETEPIKSKGTSSCKNRICVMCTNEERLVKMVSLLLTLKQSGKIASITEVVRKRFTEILSISEDDFQDAELIFLIAVPEPRNMLISDSEPSQLGAIYRKACKLNKNIFMVYTDTSYKDKLQDSQAYHASLSDLLSSQKAIGDLARRNKFISVKYKPGKSIQKINKTQTRMIVNWINESLCMGK